MKITNKQPEYAGYDIGDWTYGCPHIRTFDGNNCKLKIGKFCCISDNVTILLGGEHNYKNISMYPFENLLIRFANKKTVCSKGDILIGSDVWIGHGATILSGVTVGDGAVIGACSVVTKDVKPYSIVAGNPARHIKFRFNKYTIKHLLEWQWWNLPWNTMREKIPLLMADAESQF